MVKFSHSLFALPFAGLAAILAFLESDLMLRDIIRLSVLIIVAMISARSAAMGFNRYIDSEMDEKNPRTSDREIPKGKISPASVLFFIGLSSFVFLFSSYLINMLCFVLAFPVLFILFFYSLAKRFTLLCHFILGIAISLAPLGAWIAIREEFDWIPMLFSLGLFLHIAGFDILYAIQDMDFDKSANLHSIPARLGETNSYRLAIASHIISLAFFVFAGYVAMLGWIYYLSLAVVVLLLIEEHKISHDYAKRLLPPRFYQINSFISLIIFLGILIDRWSEVLNKLELLVRL
ncbi:putative 4-hydroxybenzoate polyprenyltransferase [Leptospira sp. GIMC2001]|nr:UbiA-like polyprenyltransferase [Leptospira sp. GIMC2001]WCL50586.1 putative 4-hydroxybenzoate polyprenyltransferase [Leptospira sp. GIMC2001]